MGEAKRRGTFNERLAAAVAAEDEKRAALRKREDEWNAKQAERRKVRLEEEALKPKISQEPERRNNRLSLAAAMWLLTSSMIGMK